MTLQKQSLSQTVNYASILILPLLSLYISLRNSRRPEAKNLFWFFCIFLGMIHIIFPLGGSTADGTRYASWLIELHRQSLTWENFSQHFFTDKYVDLYQPIVTYFISLFTNDPRWLFTVFAAVFGFFYSRNMWFLLERIPSKNTFIIWVLVLFYFLICPIWEINGVRMWTALHIFAYGALPYVYEKDTSKLVWCLVTPLVHFAFVNAVGILLIYILCIPRRVTPLLILFLITFFINSIDMEQVRSAVSFLPDFMQGRLRGYTGDTQVESFRLAQTGIGYNEFVRFCRAVSKWGMVILMTYTATMGRKTYTKDKKLKGLLCFSLFFYSVSHILALIPSGTRFLVISQIFATASLIFFFVHTQNDKSHKIRKCLIYTCILFLLAPILLQLRVGCDYYGISLLLNPVMAMMVEDNMPVIQFIKMVFQ